MIIKLYSALYLAKGRGRWRARRWWWRRNWHVVDFLRAPTLTVMSAVVFSLPKALKKKFVQKNVSINVPVNEIKQKKLYLTTTLSLLIQ